MFLAVVRQSLLVSDSRHAVVQADNARLKEENLQLQAKVDVLMSQLHGQVRLCTTPPAHVLRPLANRLVGLDAALAVSW